jgi:Na+/H+-dicarboxylate symporter
MKLWHKVTIGLFLGILFGIYFVEYISYVKPIGDVFLRLIQMIIIPLIFFSLVSGITSMNDPSSIGRVGLKSVIAFFGTTIFAVIFGIVVALALKPGEGVHINFGVPNSNIVAKSFNIIDFFIGFIPNNIFDSFAKGNIIQAVFFSIFTGCSINSMGSIANPIKEGFHIMSKLVLKMISIIVQFSPYGAFALTAWVVGTQGIEVLVSLSHLILAVSLAMFCQYIIFGVLIYVFCRISPIPFYKKSFEYQMLALSTSSSKATLGTTMQVCQEHLGISNSSTSFILPLGASINVNGSAIYLALTTIFFAQITNVTLMPYDYFIIVITATIGSIGSAGIPGAGLIMLPMILTSVHLPIEGVALIAGIDRILDMLRTTINITGDATITLIIDHSEGTLDEQKYFS